jgi:23S rRNA G2445 N2-methylase RlmL
MKQHDGNGQYFSEPLIACWKHTDVDLIVGNPPWGKNIGSGEDTFTMVHSLCRCFPLATCGFVISDWTFRQLMAVQDRHLQVHY